MHLGGRIALKTGVMYNFCPNDTEEKKLSIYSAQQTFAKFQNTKF